MQSNSSSATGNTFNPFGHRAPANTYQVSNVKDSTGNKKSLGLKDQAGLVFVVAVLLLLQLLSSIRLIK